MSLGTRALTGILQFREEVAVDGADAESLGLRDESGFQVVELLASEQARFEH
jgi:hypothetical protein